ncbi:uncharacterized protein N7503_006488 [Penicillium pulvis]|uniref:uncharacterized protein n=1 Tax=Penicillium pulvis TaxID=1562058 RepID=UPI002546951B|nr:uncharacterized protein N7503_006488 [Penicillium pulvis]KAJ5798983.1 hypothetical protein N7503_006488 [Penicillium pulvis]
MCHKRAASRNLDMDQDTRIGSYQPVKLTKTFSEELNTSRGMVALSQDEPPRNIYGPGGAQKSADLYGSIESSMKGFNSTESEFYDSP